MRHYFRDYSHEILNIMVSKHGLPLTLKQLTERQAQGLVAPEGGESILDLRWPFSSVPRKSPPVVAPCQSLSLYFMSVQVTTTFQENARSYMDNKPGAIVLHTDGHAFTARRTYHFVLKCETVIRSRASVGEYTY